MPQTLANVKLLKKSAIPADAVQNDFVFAHTATLDATVATAIADMIDDFYNAVGTGQTAALNSVLSNSLSTAVNSIQISLYDITTHLDGTPHGAVKFKRNRSLQSTGAAGLPDEVAIALTYHGDIVNPVEFGVGGIRPRSRHRGRVYIGPLTTNVIDPAPTTLEPMVSATAQANIANAGLALLGDATYTGVVWSRKNAAVDTVTGVWVDDAFDTQRRRGNKPTSRLALP